MGSHSNDIIVSIQCLTYNHVNYIRQCLDGFVMQKTNFRFEAIVHDDASTDGTAEIVKEYAEKYPDIIKPILEEENLYSKHIPGLITNIVNEKCRGKYIAICEGDDYWTDENKLQMQIDYMEKHPECTMTCTRTKLYSEKKQKFIGEQYCRKGDGFLSVKDVVCRRGLYISTCSIVFRRSLYSEYPVYCLNSIVGDYPLQMYCALKGQVFYLDTSMTVYRREIANSFMGKVPSLIGEERLKRFHIMRNQLDMLNHFRLDFPQYNSLFRNVMSQYINKGISRIMSKEDCRYYVCFFSDYINDYSIWWKFDLWLRRLPIPGIRYVLGKTLDKRFCALYTFDA